MWMNNNWKFCVEQITENSE